MHNTYENSMQNEKNNNEKNCNNNVAILQQSRIATTQKKEHTQQNYAYKKILHGRNMQHVRKSVSTGFASPNNLANVAWQHFWQITSS